MANSLGFYFMILVLVMVPLSFLGAGKDTTLKRAERKQRQREALLDWTDKDALAEMMQNDATCEISAHRTVHSKVIIEKLSRDPFSRSAA